MDWFWDARSPSAYPLRMIPARMLSTILASAPAPETGAGASGSEPAIRLMIVLAGVSVVTLLAIVLLMALRRSLHKPPPKQAGPPAEAGSTESPWSIAGRRAAPEQGPGPSGGPSIDVPGDADPNDDTWQGPSP